MAFLVRRLGPGDERLARDAVVAMAGECCDDAHLRAWLADPSRHLVVAADDAGAPIGWVYAYELPRLKTSRSGALLYEIDVAEPHRKKGVAREMIEKLLRVVRARGVDRMWVLTNVSSEPAMRLYESLGATRTNPDDAMWEWPLC